MLSISEGGEGWPTLPPKVAYTVVFYRSALRLGVEGALTSLYGGKGG